MKGLAAALLLLPAVARAQGAAPIDAEHARDAARTEQLNRTVLQRDDTVRSANDRADAEYQRQLAEYRAALDRNAAAKAGAAAADRAYAAERARYEAAMQGWQADRTAAAARRRPAPRLIPAAKDGDRIVCKTSDLTGTRTKRVRTCKPERDWKD